jgi:hypothetical protein
MSRHDGIVRVFHAVQRPLAIDWKSESGSVGLGGRDTPLDGLTVICDHDRWSLHGSYNVSLLVVEDESDARSKYVNERIRVETWWTHLKPSFSLWWRE